jgi:ethanolamine utilization protein EutN
MLLGIVKGSVVSTLKTQGIEGLKLLLVQPVNRKLEPIGALQVAVDVVQAGFGDVCVMVRSREAALAMPDIIFVPVDLALVGIVDQLSIKPDDGINVILSRGTTGFA